MTLTLTVPRMASECFFTSEIRPDPNTENPKKTWIGHNKASFCKHPMRMGTMSSRVRHVTRRVWHICRADKWVAMGDGQRGCMVKGDVEVCRAGVGVQILTPPPQFGHNQAESTLISTENRDIHSTQTQHTVTAQSQRSHSHH